MSRDRPGGPAPATAKSLLTMEAPPVRFISRPPDWRRHLRRPPGVPSALALPGLAGYPLAADSISQVISNTTLWIVGLLAGLATLFLTIGGVRYLAAGQDPGEVERAKGALRAAAIGYGLAILAPVIVTVLKSLVGG
jgi:Type IV secretion system pilin